MKKKHVTQSIILCMIFSIFLPSYAYANMDFGDLYVSEPTIVVGDTVIDEKTEISYHQNVSLTYTYNIPDSISIVSGDTMNLRVPENTLIASDFSYEINANDGSLIMMINGDSKSNTVTAIFGPFYELHKANRQGKILFYARGATMKENENWVMNKVGWNSLDHTSAIWNIIINPDSKYITNAILTDVLGENQEFGTDFLVQAEIGTYDKATQLFYPQEPIDTAKIISTNVGFVINLGTLNNAVSLTYRSNKLADFNIPYRNKAILEADGEGNKVVIEAETPGIGGGGSGSGDPDPGESDPEETTSTESSIPESTTTSDSSTGSIGESTTDSTTDSTTSESEETTSTESSAPESTTTSDSSTGSIGESTTDSTTDSTTSESEETTSTESSTPESTTTSDSNTGSIGESTTDSATDSTTSESEETTSTESSAPESTPTSDGSIESVEESITDNTTDSSRSKQKTNSSTLTGAKSSNYTQKKADKLPETGYVKSLIGLLGYSLVFITLSTVLFKRNREKNS